MKTVWHDPHGNVLAHKPLHEKRSIVRAPKATTPSRGRMQRIMRALSRGPVRDTRSREQIKADRAQRLLNLGRGPKPALAAGEYRQLLEDLRVQRNKRKAARRAA